MQMHQGVKNSPYLLRRKGVISALKEMGHDVKDFGNLEQEKLDSVSIKQRYLKQSIKNHMEVGAFNEKVNTLGCS